MSDASDEENMPGGAASAVPRWVGKGRFVAAGLLVASTGGAAFLGMQAHRAEADADARSEALNSAEERVPELLSYESSTLDDDLEHALAQTTGDFADDYGTILEDVVKPEARARKISTVAEVTAAGVVRGDRDRVVVLVFLTQTTTTRGRQSVSGSRVEVTMAPADDAWKIAGLKPV